MKFNNIPLRYNQLKELGINVDKKYVINESSYFKDYEEIFKLLDEEEKRKNPFNNIKGKELITKILLYRQIVLEINMLNKYAEDVKFNNSILDKRLNEIRLKYFKENKKEITNNRFLNKLYKLKR